MPVIFKIIFTKIFIKRLTLILGVAIILVPQIVGAVTTSTSVVQISAYVGMEDDSGGSGGGSGSGSGGGGGSSGIVIPTTVNFSGVAYPLSKVYILKDGNIVATTIADPRANFNISLNGLKTNSYTFSVYGEDSKSRKSSSFSFPIFITEGTTVNIGNIFISPTIDIDKIQVKKGDNLVIFGQSAPKSEITISVNSSPEYFFKVKSGDSGIYLYNLDTSILDLGDHKTKSKATLNNQLSSYTQPLSFLVGNSNKENKIELSSCSILRADLNCDTRVNLIDFSILAYWYKKTNPPERVDFNKDGQITLSDFSILAYYWTG